MLDTMKWLICEVSYLVSKVCILAHSHLFGYNISSSGFVAYEELVQDFMNVAKITELPSSLHSINESISVFRQYTGMDREDKPSESVVEPPSNWPTVGKIEFRNFSMKYRSDLEYALKDINLAIYPGEKIGII
ncbi:Multidrug resistance-associated protein 1, partial [Coemansia sp. RSA 2399]